MANGFTNPRFVSEMGGRPLVELPIHLVGHSRGGSLVCEVSRLLGQRGVWVDHVTTLDAHPLNNDGFEALDWLFYSAVDAPARAYETVLFADSYYQDSHLVVNGMPVPGSFWRRQTTLNGGYVNVKTGSHSDVHLWYHGTIDWRTPAHDSEAWITTDERYNWWTESETFGFLAGYTYSLIGRSDRLSTVRPNGSNSSSVRQGFNQQWDLSAGLGDNRYSVGGIGGDWPNPIRLNITSTNTVRQGDTSSAFVYYQWARPTSEHLSVELFADEDLNPLNGNEHLVKSGTASGTTASQIGGGAIDFTWDPKGTKPGR